MQAQGDHLLVKIPKAKLRSSGGIELPDNATQTYYHARVLSMGPGADLYLGRPSGILGAVRVGDYILFDQAGSVPIQLDPLDAGSLLTVIDKSQVYARVDAEQLKAMNLPVSEDAPAA